MAETIINLALHATLSTNTVNSGSVPPIYSLTGKGNLLQKSFLSADNMDSPVSCIIQYTLISANLKTQPSLIHSPDTQTAQKYL